MKGLFDYDYILKAGDEFLLKNIINEETYERMFNSKYVSFLNKGECGNGGTTGFVRYALEHNKGCLILVPNRSIVISKEEEYKDNSEVCCVYGGSGSIDTDAMIVIATYDQFPRLLECLSSFGFARSEDIWSNEFWSGRTIIIDEYHKLVDECGFRDTCHKVTELVRSTDSGVVLMSATPHWEYIDFTRDLVNNREVITYNIDYVDIDKKCIQVYDIKRKDLKSILNKVKKSNDQTCVVCNCVKEIEKIIDQIGGDDCEVLCSVDNEKELGKYYSKSFNKDKKLHFMTSSHFTGYDIRTYVKQCIIVGSREFESMCLGERDIKQMIGRFREGVGGIHLFYLNYKVKMENYQAIKDKYDEHSEMLRLVGDKWVTSSVSIKKKQEAIRLKDTLERFDYWASKRSLENRLERYGFVVKEKKIGEFEGIGQRKKLTFKEAQRMIASGESVTYDDNKYSAHIREYMEEKGVEDMLLSSRETIINWYQIRKNVGITDLELLTPEEKFKVMGFQHFGRYKASFLMDCMKYLGVACEYDNLTVKMRETLGCYVSRWKADPKGKPAGDIYIVFVKLKSWETPPIMGMQHYKGVDDIIPKTGGMSYRLSYQTEIKDKNCYGKTVLLKDAPLHYNSLSNINLYKWVNEDKEHRLPEVKGGKDWSNIKNYRQTKISELYKDTDKEYRHSKASMDYIDCLIVDVDSGITFNEFKERYGNYVWVAYPTINNIPDDWNRFRVIVPLKNKIKIGGEYNVMTLKMLRSMFCYYEDPNHQVTSYINSEDWQKRIGNSGDLFDIPQSVVDDIMLSIRNSKEMVMMRFDENKVNVAGFHKAARTLEWAQDYFKSSFELGDGMRHTSLFIIKNSLNERDRDLFQSWLMREYPRYMDKWKSHKVVNCA